jgi:hypothetical protein
MSNLAEFNQKIGVKITDTVGTMGAAYIFAALSLVSLPAVLATGNPVVIIGWITQTFLQLVLLPIIIVGQAVQGQRMNDLVEDTHRRMIAEQKELHDIHLAAVAELHSSVKNVGVHVGVLTSKVEPKKAAPAKKAATPRKAAAKTTTPKEG